MRKEKTAESAVPTGGRDPRAGRKGQSPVLVPTHIFLQVSQGTLLLGSQAGDGLLPTGLLPS